MPKNLLLAALVCSCALNAFNSSATELARELAMNPDTAPFWRSRVNNLLTIEENLMRRKRFHSQTVNSLSNFVNEGKLDVLNQFINHSNVSESATYTERVRQFLNQKKSFKQSVNYLPKLETEVYRGQTMSPQIWQKLRNGDGYFVKGFYSGTGSLHLAHADARNALDIGGNSNAKKLILKIKGKKSRLANLIYQNDQSDILWDEQTHFKIIDKDYNPETETYFLHLDEISNLQASKLSHIINAHDGTTKHIRGSSCS